MNPSTAAARVLVDELIRCGVREAVLCPGSRSAPLAYALRAADAAGDLRLHVRIDERTAAFLALGLAKVSGLPVPVVTTSGTAVANLHPAVLEAHHSGVPLLVLSADRPAELRGVGANQATRQPGMFAGATRWEHDLGAPGRRGGDAAVWRSTIVRAVAAARGWPDRTDPGPVHLNVPFRDPLAPDPPEASGRVTDDDIEAWDQQTWGDGLAGRADGAPWVLLGDEARQALASLPPRTLVLLGDVRDREVRRAAGWLALERGWPVVAESLGPVDPSVLVESGASVLGVVDWVDREQSAPDAVLVVGRLTLHRTVAAVLRRPDTPVVVVAEGRIWPDASHVAAAVVAAGDLPDAVWPAPLDVDTDWFEEWRRAGERVAQAQQEVVAQSWPSGPAVAAAVRAALTAGDALVLGSSNPVRDLGHAGAPATDVRVVANRGLAGIDGMVSTAIGAALAAQEGRPRETGGRCVALLGDLTFLHDATALALGPEEPRPDLTIVVVNDDGGGIFGTLEYGDPRRLDADGEGYERVFGTPTGTDLAAWCRAHDVAHERVEDPHALAAALAARPRGIRVLEVPVPRRAERDLGERLRAAAAAALAESG